MIFLQALIGMSILIFLEVCAIMFFGTIGLMSYFNHKLKTERKRPLTISDRLIHFGKGVGISLLISVLFTLLIMAFFSIFLHDPY